MAPSVDDPYEMAIASIDEAIRNVVAVGADPKQIAILDNFCWPSVDDEKTMGTLVRACEACRDAALAHGIPFISGKDSLHNQFTNQETGEIIRIPPTLLISAIAVLDDVRKCVTMDLKSPSNRVVLIEAKDTGDLTALAQLHRAVAALIASGKVAACHDVSDGGIAIAAAEMCIASGLGLITGPELLSASAFIERPGRYLIELAQNIQPDAIRSQLAASAVVSDIGVVQQSKKFSVASAKERIGEIPLDELTTAWRGTLDW
jgi:phosphoribosylformylglycinamidine synthase